METQAALERAGRAGFSEAATHQGFSLGNRKPFLEIQKPHNKPPTSESVVLWGAFELASVPA